MKVVWYHTDIPVGGAETVTINIARALIEKKSAFEPVIITSNLTAELPGIEVHTIAKGLTPRNPEGRKAIISKLKELKADIYIQPQDTPPVWLRELRREMPDLKIVYHMHSLPFWQVKDKVSQKPSKQLKQFLFRSYTRRWLKRYRSDYAQADHWVTLCDKYTNKMRSLLGDRVSTMYNPIELSRFSSLREFPKQKEVLCLSRLTRRDKRIDRILRAWKRVHLDFPDWKLKIVGTGEDEDDLKELAKKLKLTNIEFCGHSNNPGEHYKTASILCLTSAIEGWGLVIIEAFASGVNPLVMNCSDGVSEIIEKTGIESVGPGKVKAFAEKLRLMMTEQRPQPELTPFIHNLDCQQVAARWEELFENLAGGKFACKEISE